MAMHRYATMNESATKWGEAVNFLERGLPIETVAALVALPLETLTKWWALRQAGKTIRGLHYAKVRDGLPSPDELAARTAEAKAAQLRRKALELGGDREYAPKVQEVVAGMSGKRRR